MKIKRFTALLAGVFCTLTTLNAQHFVPVYTSVYQPMNIIVTAATLDGLDLGAGDEIGIFDIDGSNEICVGSAVLTGPIGATPLAVVASTDDPLTPEKDGFTAGNTIIYRFWDSSENTEIICVSVTYTPGYDEVFTSLGTAVPTLSGITSPTVDAGSDDAVCENASYSLSATASNQSSVLWTTAGDGTFDNAASLTAVYTPGTGDLAGGSVTLTITAYAIAPCTDHADDDIVLTIQDLPTASAGADAEICEGSSHTLSGSATNQQSVLWTTAGDGTFDDATLSNATYTPGTNDISNGSVLLTLTATAIAPCAGNASDNMTLDIQKQPTANAGADGEVCEGSAYTLSGSATNQQSVLWTTAGDGTFDDATLSNATYTPGSGDISNGSVVLTLTATAIAPCAGNASDNMTLDVQKQPTANAGADAEICEGSSHTLSGSATNQQSVLWTTAGDGTFDDATLTNATYTPGSGDIAGGSVMLTLTATAIAPCAGNASDNMSLDIQKQPTANAGADGDVCEGSSYTLSGSATNQQSVLWTTAGDGTFDDATLAGATYTPGAGDIAAGSVVLTLTATAIAPCTGDASDDMTLDIQKQPTANAGADGEVCEGSSYTLSGSATNQQSVLWTTAGDGTFDDATLSNATYTPGNGDIAGGSVVLTLTATAIAPCAGNASDNMTLDIQKQPTANAGADGDVCEGSSYTLSGSATNQQSVLWTTAGDGTFDDATLTNATYTPGSGDITNGSVVLTLTATAIAPCAGNASDNMTLDIQKQPTANAGADGDVCEGSSYTLSGSATNQQSVLWTTAGDGTFDDATLAGATYTPGAGDIAAGSVMLTLTATAIAPCAGDTSDDMTLDIQKQPTADAGADAEICEGSSHTLSGSATNQQLVLWTTAGDGTFDDATLSNATYTPGSGDIAGGSVVLTLTATAIAPCAGDASDNMTLDIQKQPTANAGADADICEGSSHTLTGSASNQQSVLWTTAGDGSFDDATLAGATYTPGAGDISNGSVVLTFTAAAILPCASDVSDDMTLNIFGQPTADAGADDDVCENGSYTLSGAATNQQSVLWTTGGDGSFDDASLAGATYTPGAGDIAAGSVVLTFTAVAMPPCGTDASDNMTLSIQDLPTAYAGADDQICEDESYLLSGSANNQFAIQWTTAGDGTFDDPILLAATYTPGAGDIANGSVTLTLTATSIPPCNTNISDAMTLDIQALPEADAGPDDTVEEGNAYTLSGTASGHQSVLWTTAGDGTFDDATLLNATYTPGTADIDAGFAVLTLTASAVSPCTSDDADDMTLFISVTQQINLNQGWNIMSFYVVPADMNMLNIVQPLISNTTLIKVMDENGDFIQFLSGAWVNFIGDMANTEGYYIKVTDNTSLNTQGTLVVLPFNVPLFTGWNMMGYPVKVSQDAITVLQPLISSGNLIKVMDESGNFIQNIPPYGWLNTIVNLDPGEGYYIKVGTDDNLVYNQPTKASAPLSITAAPKTQHFFASGANPFNPMNIVITNITSDGFEVEQGDEIAVYDGDIEVGSAVIQAGADGLQLIIAAGDDPATDAIEGYTTGNDLSFRYWDKSLDMVYENVLAGHISGEKQFAGLGTYVGELKISALGIYENPGASMAFLGQNHPNPFTQNTTIAYGLYQDGQVLLSIHDVSGRTIRVLEDACLSKGKYSVSFGNGALEPGIYYYRLQVSSKGMLFTDTKKMIVQ
jgi:hypothetical protein